MPHKSISDQNNRQIVSPDLILKNERSLPMALSKALLRRFLKESAVGSVSDDEFADAYMSRLDNFSYTVIMIRLNDDAFINSGVMPDQESGYETHRDKIFNFYHAALQSKYPCFPAIIDGIRIFVLEINGIIEEYKESYNKALSGLENYLLEKQAENKETMLLDYGFIPQIMASDIRHDLSDMPAMFQQLLFSIDYIFESHPGRNVITFLLTYQEIPDTSNMSPKPDFEQLYFDCIAGYNFSMANIILQQRIIEETKNPATSISVRLRLHARMMWTLSFLGLPINRSLSDCVAIYGLTEQISSCKTISDVKSCVEEFFQRLTAYYRKSPQGSTEKIDMISEYVKENYRDPSLSVSNICDIFNISIAHLSRAFKKKTGIRLIDYIHLTRLAQAKELLINSDKNLDEIAKDVGYSGDWTLARAFKRFEGRTPGSLRTSMNETDLK